MAPLAVKDRLRDRPVIGTAIAVQERYEEDLGNQLAGSLAFFMFLSVFPMLLAALSLAGYVLETDVAAQTQIRRAVSQVAPGLSTAMSDTIDTVVDNRSTIGWVAALLLLFTGLRVVDSAQTATSAVYRHEADVNAITKRLLGLLHVTVLGLLAVLGTFAASTGALLGSAATAVGLPEGLAATLGYVGLIVTFAVDLVFFLVAYRLLALGEGPGWRDLWPGALLAATGWGLLKFFGAAYVSRQAERWDELLGTLGTIIAVLLLLFLAGRIYLYGAELNAVLCERHGRRLMDDDGPR